MHGLKELFSSHVDWLADRVQSQAADHGIDGHPGVSGKPHSEAVVQLNEALFACLDQYGVAVCSLSVCAQDGDPGTVFAIKVAQRHRERGVDLAAFMGLLKLYRHAYIRLVEQNVTERDEQEVVRAFVARFFDRIEIVQCVNWMESKAEEERVKDKENLRVIGQERNRFRTLFESLRSPVFMVNDSLGIETMNLAAAEFLGISAEPGDLEYAMCNASAASEGAPASRVSLKDMLPWLADEISKSYKDIWKEQNIRFDVSVDTKFGPSHYSVTISSLANVSESYTGHTIVLDDISGRVEVERQLSQERNRAAHYLDVVGAIVLAMDASGGVTLINKTGCRVLGYNEFEVLGQNWVNLAVPLDERDEIQDYFYHLFSEGADVEDEHINHVLTKDGEVRLIAWTNKLLLNEGGLPVGILSSGMDITEQQATEDALAEKELWLRNTFLALGEAVLIMTPDNEILDANPAAEVMFQMTNEEICAASIVDLHVDQEHYEDFERRCIEAFEKGKTAQFEFLRRRKNGQVFPTEQSVSKIIGDDGSPLGIVSVTRDISRRKAAELDLKRSEEKFRRIFDSIEEGYLVAGLDGNIQMVNPATCELLGYEADELVGTPMTRLYADIVERGRFIDAIKSQGAVRGYNLEAIRKDGSIIVTEANAHLVLDSHGMPQAMEGTFRDITARIEAEKILREREKQYRAFFENNHAIMLLVDPKTEEIVDANPAAAHFYGYSVPEMRSLHMSVISAQTEEDIYREMFKARDEGRVYFILKHKLQSGEIRDVEVYSGPILVQGRQLLYSVIHDVTVRIRLEREMKRMATTDALTGTSNRHEFFDKANKELARSSRYGHPLTVLMLDIDYFKSINDTYGHQTGDDVLKVLSETVAASLREVDIFGRLGGEEFAVILPETGPSSGIVVAERLRGDIEKLRVESKDGEEVQFTASIGVSSAREGDQVIEDVINRADEALYKAKRTGRNKVVKN